MPSLTAERSYPVLWFQLTLLVVARQSRLDSHYRRRLSTFGTLVESIRPAFQSLLFAEGTTMAETHYEYRDPSRLDESGRSLHAIETLNHPGLKYSSPKPWFLALGVSLAMWAALGRVIWILFK